ncbi:nucleotide-binding domain-containing protein [Edwardsiella tarda]|uniref:nucleotide-binding domain-containing protein n=1 Tax=Edwardsiella tarda TaxID=636 RepID=UPI003D2ED7C6
MQTAEMFQSFLNNLKIPDERMRAIATHYKNATRILNLRFRGSKNGFSNRLKVGSAGRRTAVSKTSDLDMLYIMPAGLWWDYQSGTNPQRRLLHDVKEALKQSFTKQKVKVDRLVVQIIFDSFHIEVQPVFETDEGDFKYPDTKANDGNGGWKVTKPRMEITEMRNFRNNKSRNLHNLCRMLRAWKNRNTVDMGGLLIDTLAWRFLKQTDDYNNTGMVSYGLMCRDFFDFLRREDPHKHYAAIGSGQRVKVYRNFQRQAKRAFDICTQAIEAYENDLTKKCHEHWREVFGLTFPKAVVEMSDSQGLESANLSCSTWRNTEEFTDEKFDDVDIRYPLEVNCIVKENGYRERSLRAYLADIARNWLPPNRTLSFSINQASLDIIPEPYEIYWKVLNRGREAEQRDDIRGQIILGQATHTEHTKFRGNHKVWCYIVKNHIVIAQSVIDIPIE